MVDDAVCKLKYALRVQKFGSDGWSSIQFLQRSPLIFNIYFTPDVNHAVWNDQWNALQAVGHGPHAMLLLVMVKVVRVVLMMTKMMVMPMMKKMIMLVMVLIEIMTMMMMVNDNDEEDGDDG